MTNTNKIEIHWWYDYDKFENDLVPRVNEFIRTHKGLGRGTFQFDLSNTTSGDLMELACLLLAADYIHLETGCECEFKFIVPDEVKAGLRFLELLLKRSKLSRSKKALLIEILENEKKFFDKRIKFARYLTDNLAFFSLLSEKRWGSNITDCNVYRKQSMLFPELFAPRNTLWLRLISFRNLVDLLGEGGILERLKAEMVWRLPFPEKQRMSFSKGIISSLCENVLSHAYGDGREPDCALVGIRQIPRPETQKNRDNRLSNAPDWLRDFFKFYLDDDLTEVTVVDGGKGIYQSLRPAYEVAEKRKGSELDVLEWSFGPGTSRFRYRESAAALEPGPEVGWGLWDVKSFVNAWGGLIYARTGQSRVVYFPKKFEKEPNRNQNLVPFPGTQYRIILPSRECVERIREVEESKQELMKGLF